MPRAKVKPQDRQRAVLACLACKRSKIKCDAASPCGTCVKRGRATSCTYQELSLASPSPTHLHSVSTPDVDQIGAGRGSKKRSSDSKLASRTRTKNPTIEAINDDEGDEEQEPSSRMLLSSTLQKVYVGETASISYLQFLRHVLKRRVGPCAFTEGDFNDYMLESDSVNTKNAAFARLDPVERRSFAQSYLDATCGIIDVCPAQRIFATLENPSAPDTLIDTASVNLIIAIGAQCRGTGSLDAYLAADFFGRAREISFENFVCNPTIAMIRHFLLMAFYLLGACHRNGASMYLGIAAKAATSLGMHKAEHYRGLPADEWTMRVSIWKSLRALDTIVNSILGRSGGLSGLLHDSRFDSISEKSLDGSDIRGRALHAVFDICPFMDELERKGSNQDIAFAKDFLQRLQSWCKSLPDELRHCTEGGLQSVSTSNRAAFISGMHVACVYYFVVMLTTRRFLTLHILPQVRKKGPVSNSNLEPETQAAVYELAHVCLDAAVNLASLGNSALKSGHMLNNMCLIKAWMFAAGLLIGFSRLVKGSEDELGEAFEHCRATLKQLSISSAQAKHYHEILSTFADAINLHQRKSTEERRRATSQYMDRIFATDQNTVRKPGMRNSNITAEVTESVNNMPDLEAVDLGNFDPLLNQDDSSPSLLDFPWTMDDMLSMDWQPFTPFFDQDL